MSAFLHLLENDSWMFYKEFILAKNEKIFLTQLIEFSDVEMCTMIVNVFTIFRTRSIFGVVLKLYYSNLFFCPCYSHQCVSIAALLGGTSWLVVQ